VTYAAILHFLATGQRLFENVCVRTADTDVYPRVAVGCFNDKFDELEFIVGAPYCDVDRAWDLGLASYRES
jgi:hypothetical protein